MYCDPIWHVTPHSYDMGVPLTATSSQGT